MPPRSQSALYWQARVAMLPSIDDLDAFHAVFLEFFGALGDADALARLVRTVDAAPPRDRRELPKRETLPPPPSDEPADERLAERAPVQWIVASSEHRLADKAFEDFDESERAAMLRMIARVRIAGGIPRVTPAARARARRPVRLSRHAARRGAHGRRAGAAARDAAARAAAAGGVSARRVRLDGALRPRALAVRARHRDRAARGARVRVRHAAHRPHAAAEARDRRAPHDRDRRHRPRLGRRHAYRRRAARVQRPLRRSAARRAAARS